MVGENDYYLKWDKHHALLVSSFDHLYENGLMVDCTLTAEKKFIKVHRVVLMACSPYFEEILASTPDQYPIFFLDIKFSELEAIVQFCYRGEVRVTYDDLEGFLWAANRLQIHGLCIEQHPAGKQQPKDVGGGGDKKGDAISLKRKDCSGGGVGHSGKVARRSVDEQPYKVVKSATCGDSAVNGRRASGDVASEVSDDGVKSAAQATSGKLTNGDSDKKHLVDGGLIHHATVDQQESDNSDVDSDDSSTAGDDTEEETDGFRSGFINSDGLAFNWICDHCGEAFTARQELTTHRITCSPIPGLDHSWKCDQCPNTYKNKKDLVRHEMYCGRELPRLECQLCGKSYKYERGLRRHQKYCGTEVQPLNCSDCGKIYKYKRGLRRHRLRCSSSGGIKSEPFNESSSIASASPSSPSGGPLIEPSSDAPGGGVFSCSVCRKSYKYRKSFVKHLELCAPPLSSTRKPASSENVTSCDSDDSSLKKTNKIIETKDKK